MGPADGDVHVGAWRVPTTLLVSPLVALKVASWVGVALLPVWAYSHPLWLVALSPKIPVLVIAGSQAPCWQVIAIGAVRSCLGDPFTYLLGRRFGPKVTERLAPRFRPFAWLSSHLERLMQKRSGGVLVALWGDSRVVATAGACRMPVRSFVMSTAAGAVVSTTAGVYAPGSASALAASALDERAVVPAVALALMTATFLVLRRRR